MPEPDWTKALRKPLWTIHEAVCYLAEEEPAEDNIEVAKQQVLSESATPKAREMYRFFKDARIAQEAAAQPGPFILLGGWYGYERIKPADAISLARSNGHDVPEPLQGLMADAEQANTTHEPSSSRSDEMTAPIEMAIERAAAPNDTNSVWAALEQLANSNNPPPPLIRALEGEIEYRGYDDASNVDTKFFTKKNLADRLRRRRNKAR